MKHENIISLTAQLDLPEQYESYLSLYFEPIVEIIHKLTPGITVPVVGINGSQGSGKTTLAMMLQALLEAKYDHHVVVISIDDFIIPKKNVVSWQSHYIRFL